MVDFAMDIYKELHGSKPPASLSAKREKVVADMQALRDQVAPILDLVTDVGRVALVRPREPPVADPQQALGPQRQGAVRLGRRLVQHARQGLGPRQRVVDLAHAVPGRDARRRLEGRLSPRPRASRDTLTSARWKHRCFAYA